jgi:hypothetical protein
VERDAGTGGAAMLDLRVDGTTEAAEDNFRLVSSPLMELMSLDSEGYGVTRIAGGRLGADIGDLDRFAGITTCED